VIDLESPAVQIDSLMLYPGVESGVWHVLPSRPTLRRSPDGGAHFSLVKYRHSAFGHAGALLRLSAELFEPASSLDQAASHLQHRHGPNVRLAPLRADAARCDLLVWRAGMTDLHTASGFPATTEPFEAAFETGLSPEGAMLYQTALQAAPPQGALVYWLKCPARRPAIDAKVTLDGRAIVRAFTGRAGPGALSYREIADALPALREQGAIRIELMSDAEHAIAQTNDAIERVVLTSLFESTIGIGPGFESRDTLSPEQLGFETRRFTPRADPGGRMTIDLTTPEDTHVTLARAATITELLEPFGGSVAGLVRETEDAPA
jgi:hypothetical protein